MKNKFIILTLISFLVGSCSEKLYKKGVSKYNTLEFSEAIPNFESYLKKKDKPDAIVKLAHSYRMTGDMLNAEKWYAKAVGQAESDPVNMFYYGKVLMSLEKYEEAKPWLLAYTKRVPDDFMAEMLLASCNTVKNFKTDTSLFTVKEAEIPELKNVFAQTPYESGLMFTADKMVFNKSEKYAWTGNSYLGLYFSKKDKSGKWLSPMMLKGDVNGAYHDGPACFTEDGNTVYFTRSNSEKDGKLRKNSKHENNLKIYKAEFKGEKWTNITELPFNSDDYSCGHPSLSSDGKTIFFVSDKPGGMGGTDIYKSIWNGKEWDAPINLGSSVNTEGNEMFPYMHNDGTLYFSSDAHNNLGGLDVFMTTWDGKKWLQVENLNYPLNSSSDDFAFIMNKDNKTGYVSSNRNGNDKIYEVTKNDPTFILSGVVRHKGKMQGVDSAVIEFNNITSGKKELFYSDSRGLYKGKLKPGSEYVISAGRAMYFPITSPIKISTLGKKTSENFIANFELDQIIIQKPIVLQNIYYDLDKWNIRPDAATELNKLVQVLKDNPRIQIELSSHTDSRAGDQYNLVLSDKRAKAAVDYLIANGIDSKRLKWKGYGETKILNKCANKVECSEEEHQMNRRTEFKVIKIMDAVSVK